MRCATIVRAVADDPTPTTPTTPNDPSGPGSGDATAPAPEQTTTKRRRDAGADADVEGGDSGGRKTVVYFGIGLLIAAVLGGAVIVLTGRDDPPTEPIARAAAFGERACDRLDTFERLVKENAAAAKVTEELEAAIADASKAAELDPPRWIPLQSGAKTLEIALEEDDPGATRVGIGVVRSNCEIARQQAEADADADDE